MTLNTWTSVETEVCRHMGAEGISPLSSARIWGISSNYSLVGGLSLKPFVVPMKKRRYVDSRLQGEHSAGRSPSEDGLRLGEGPQCSATSLPPAVSASCEE